MRWILSFMLMMLVLALGSGCQRQIFLTEKDLSSATGMLSVQLEHNPTVGASAITMPVNAPPTVDFPERSPRYLSLQEAIAMALEKGTASSNVLGANGSGGGVIDNTLPANNRGLFNNQIDNIRVLSFYPAIAHTTIEASESRYDPKLTAFLTANVLDDFQLKTTLNGEFVNAGAFLFKELSSGGLLYTGIGSTNPQNQAFQASFTSIANSSQAINSNLNGVNNVYNIPLTIGIDQPLLRDFGWINQLLNQISPQTGFLPGEGLAGFFNNQKLPLSQGPNFNGLATPGILLARLQFDQARAEFERQVNNLLLNTEIAYWRLYQAYGQLYANEEVLRLAQRVYSIAGSRSGAGILNPPYILSNIEAQYHEFRTERVKALGLVLEAEHNLRRIIGLPIEDGSRLIPVTPPSFALYIPNWEAARQDALALRPELVLARQNMKNAQYNLMIQKNFLKPDLRLLAQYQPVGIGTTLTGNASNFFDFPGGVQSSVGRPANAFRELASDHFDNWFVGTVLNVPLGYRLELAGVRAARLAVVQSYYVLEDVENRTVSILGENYQKLDEWWRRIEYSRREHESYAEAIINTWKRVKVTPDPKTGGDQTANYQLLLDSQRRLALALQKEYEAVAEYNSTLARFEWAKGSIMVHDNVTISEGPLPECVQGRAVENERQRTSGLILMERPTARPITHPGFLAGDKNFPEDLGPAPGGPMHGQLDNSSGKEKPAIGPPPRLLDKDSGLPESAQSMETIPHLPQEVPVIDHEDRLPPPLESSTTGTKEAVSSRFVPERNPQDTLPDTWFPDSQGPAVGDPPPLPRPPVERSHSSESPGHSIWTADSQDPLWSEESTPARPKN